MRRTTILFALALATAALAACADQPDPTGPRRVPSARAQDGTCRSGYQSSDGRFVCTDSTP